MNDMLLVYITCKDEIEAKSIGRILIEKKLCACVNIVPNVNTLLIWPPESKNIDESTEVVLIAKTLASHYSALEDEASAIHSYDLPCILSIPVAKVSKKYYEWVVSAIS